LHGQIDLARRISQDDLQFLRVVDGMGPRKRLMAGDDECTPNQAYIDLSCLMEYVTNCP